MELMKKLQILSAAAKYDVSCSSSGSHRKNQNHGIGNAAASGICHSFTPDGRCISLLKILLTNDCLYNCTYCVNRSANDVERTAFTPEEIAELTINFYKRNYIEGLFLSSAIYKSPDYTMELLYRTLYLLRHQYKFNGYIHVKAIPGADLALIQHTGALADRMSVNVELPSENSLKRLAPQKSPQPIYKPMSYIHKKIASAAAERKKSRKAPLFVPGGQSTQLIIGASAENDFNILSLSENLYQNYQLKRVYYSAYVPVNTHSALLPVKEPPLLREHRLYQADWLLRFYGFSAHELLTERNPYFDEALDPKSQWALRHLKYFPVEITRADKHFLLRIPGIGIRSAQKILLARQIHSLSFTDLKKLGAVLKRAQYFITCNGKYYGQVKFEETAIRSQLAVKPPDKKHSPVEQLSLFSSPALIEDLSSGTTGEL